MSVEQPGRGSTRETEVGLAECQQAEYIHMCHRMVGVWVPDGMKATPWEADLKETPGKTERARARSHQRGILRNPESGSQP